MSTTLKILILVFEVYIASTEAALDVEGYKHITCEEFSRGVTFRDNQALGIWHLLQHKNSKGSKYRQCYEFTQVIDQERQILTTLFTNLTFENITLKMEVPCAVINPRRPSLISYLHTTGGIGSYNMIQLPRGKDVNSHQLDLSKIIWYKMHLKIIENKFLSLLDCAIGQSIVTAKQTPEEGLEINENIKKLLNLDWSSDIITF